MNKDFQKWGLTIAKKYQKLLLLEDYVLRFEQGDSLEEDDRMISYISFPYKEIRICYGANALDVWKKGNKEQLRQTIIHELTHTISNPLFEKARRRYVSYQEIIDCNEEMVDHFANVIMRLGV